MNIETKANVGDTVFYLKRINRVPCPVCAGTGKIYLGTAIKPNAESPATFAESIGEQFMQNLTEMMTGNVRTYNFPECGGKGTVKATGQAKYEVGEGVVIAVEATMSQDKEKVIYRVTDSGNYTNRTVADDKLYLDQADVQLMRDKRVLLVDDVISTGESLVALEQLVLAAGAEIAGRMCILAEGDAQARQDITYLEGLPLFDKNGEPI